MLKFSSTQAVKGIAGIWNSEETFLKAAQKVRDSGVSQFEAITPYPIHHLDAICGIRRSIIPYVTFVMGMVGMLSGLALTWWTSAVNWPLNVGGKPPFSLPAFVPIIFELTILFGALFSVGALFYLCGIPRKNPPILDPDLTSHKFALFVPLISISGNEKSLSDLMQSLGAERVLNAEF